MHARRAEAESAQTEERRRADVLNRAVRRLANRALAGAFAKWVKAIDDRARAAMEAKVAEMELERDALHREREEVGSAVFENGRLTERVEALALELDAAKVKIAESERRTEEAARVAARERIRARKFSDEYETIRRDASAREAELRIELTSAANHPMIGVTTVEVRELKARCRDLKAENKRAKGEIDRIAAEAKKDVEDLKTKLAKANEAANKAKAARIRARKAGEARTAVEEDLTASNALGDALTAELREREDELAQARAELERCKSDVLGLAQAERNAASLLMEGKRVWVSLEANLREQIASAEGRRVEAEARCVSIASTADRQIRLAEEESHELRAAMTPGGTKLATEPTSESVDDLRGQLRKALDECAEANERARDAEDATRAAQAKIESMKWPKSLTSPDAGGDAGTESCLVDRAADQRVATLRWYAAALNSRRASAIARVESLENDLVDAKAESADAKTSMLEAAGKVRECAMESEANASARRLLERDLATTKADLAKARKLNVEGQMNRSSLRIELAEAKASVDAMASAMAQTQVPSDTPDAHRARESLVKRVGTTSSPSSPQFMSATVVSATKTVRLRSSSTSSTPTNPAMSPRPAPHGATKTSYSNAERNIGQPRGGKESDPGRDILAGAVSHADDVSHAALRARLHASTRANDEIRRLCETYARDAASAEAKALGAAREIDDARRDAAEAAAVSAEAKRQVATLESRVARAEGGVADAAVKAVKAGCEAAAARADAAAARAQLQAAVAGVDERGGEGTREGKPTSESPSGAETSLEEVAARLEFAEDAVAEALASRAESDAALSDGAASLASVIAERNALGSRCQSLVDSIASLRASVGERRAEVFEALRDADAQKSRADACEHVANRLDAELEAVFTRLSSASNGEGDASVASEARLAIAKAQLAHKREFIRAADASLATQRARVEDAERRAGRACADAENAWAALRDARRFSVDRAVKGTNEEDKGDNELGDAMRRLEECEAERAALATSLDEAIRGASVLTDDLARERAKVAGERARADAATAALGKMETDKCAEVPAAGGDAAIAAAAAERARCVALASANVELHAHVAELAKMPAIGDETARETAEKRLADLGVGVDVRDATDSARMAATTCAVLQTELVDVTRQLEEATREMERMKRDKAEARERRRKFDLASPGIKSPSPTTPLNDSRSGVRASDSKLADCEARLAAANARVSFLESALVRHGASSKDGTPLGTPLGTPTKGKGSTPTANLITPKSHSDVDDLRTRLAAATRRADSAEAAAAEAEATAEAASRAAVDADAACAKIQKAAGDRASAAEARSHSAELEIDDLRLEKTRLTDELRDARAEARSAAVDAAAARAALDEASESIGEAQTGAHSTHVELVEARMETAKVRGEGALALFELARTQVKLLADGDVDGARTAAESAMDDSRDAARVWSERAATARGGDGSGSAGPGSMSGPAASLLESGGVASRAQQLMADALAEEMGMH